MKIIRLGHTTAIALLLGGFQNFAGADTLDFAEDQSGRLPKAWTPTITGEGRPDWSVTTDASAPSPPLVLMQSAVTPKPSYPLCLLSDSSLQDGFVEVKFKAVRGTIDQAGGVVWRAMDNRNYYVCRANALEDNVVLYKVEKGKRTALDIVGRKGGYGVATKVTPNEWHTLRIAFRGSVFTVTLNGKDLFKTEDTTFQEPGMVGLWTKADSVTAFDDFKFGQ